MTGPRIRASQLRQMPAAGVSPQPIRTEPSHRSRTMYLLYEDLARVHIAERLEEAERQRRISRIKAARRLARRAERASQRARRALALAAIR
jgi:hypothetical protein